MRPGRTPASEPSDYRKGFVAGMFTTAGILIGGAAVIRGVEWARSTDVVAAITAALTQPTISVVDLLSLAFIGLILYVVVGMLMMHRGGAA